jgi:hypothetical protein
MEFEENVEKDRKLGKSYHKNFSPCVSEQFE